MKDDSNSKELPRKKIKNARHSTRKSTDTVSHNSNTEQTMKETDLLFRTIFKNAADGMLLADNESKKFFMGNQQIYEALGYGPEEIKNMSVMDIYPEKDLPHILDQFEKLMRNEIAVAKDIPVKRKDGSIYYADIKALPVTLKDKTYLVGIFMDITERKLAEEALRERDEYLQTILENAEEIIHMIAWDGTFLYISPSWERYTGFHVSETVGKSFVSYVHPDDQAACLEVVNNVNKTGQPQKILEFRVRHASGKWIWFMNSGVAIKDAEGKPLYFMGVAMDITERKHAEEALQASEALLKRVFDNSRIPIVVMDAATWEYIDCNPAAIAIYEFTSREETLGKTPLDVSAPVQYDGTPTAEKTRFYIGKARAEGSIVFEWRHQRPSGEIWDAEVHLMSFRVGQRELLQFSMIDITKRKQTEAALRASEEKFSLAFRNSPTVMAITSLSDGRFIDVNESFLSLHGFERNEIIGHSSYELGLLVDRALLDAIPQEARASGMIKNREIQFRKKAGGTFQGLLSAVPLAIAREPCLLSQVIDITERKQAEEELQKLASVVKHTSELINLATPDGMMIYLNEAGMNMLGISVDEVARTHITQVIPDRLTEKVQKEVLPAMMAGGWEGELEYKNLKTGALTPVHATIFLVKDSKTGAPLYHANVSLNISEHKRAEEALRESEELYTRLVDTIPDLIVRTDLDGKILFVNDYAVQISGYSREEIEGQNMLMFVSPEDRDRMMHNASLMRERRLGPQEYQLMMKDGRKIPFEVNGDVLRSGDGTPFGLVNVCRDITQRKEDEQEKGQLQTQLIQAQKMESIGRLAGGVAHDFNNMLSVILGNTEMAMDGVDPSDPLCKVLQDILNAGHRSADLTRQLLAFARKQVAVPKVLDLNDTVSGMLKMLRRLIGEDIDLAWMPGLNLWSIRIDPSQVDQILANLTVNARDAIDGVGRVTIETSNTVLDESYCAGREECITGEYVMLAVSDDGCGMEKEILSNIFEPFFTTKKEGHGTGLGLATVYGIVRQNSGFINVYSEPSRGTTFRIYLPRHKAEGMEAAEYEEEMVQGGTETILIVEDDEAVLNLSKGMLERLGYHVLVARKPDEAMMLAREYEGNIELLFTDVVMPDMNGKELSEKMRSIRPGMECLYMSGYTADVIARQGILEEGVHFIPKPFSLKVLAAKVLEILGK